MNLTNEQEKIIGETIINKPGTYSIQAVAGSGKSFTIFKAIDTIKENQPNAKILYLVFNKANQIDAQRKLFNYSSWAVPVEVKTAHGFAYQKWQRVIGPFTALERLNKDIIMKLAGKSYITDVKYSKHASFHWLQDKYHSSRYSLKSFCEEMLSHWDDTYEGPDKPCDIEIMDKYGKKRDKFGIQVDNYSYVSKEHIHVFKKIVEEHERQKLYTHGMYLKAAAYSNKTGGSEYDYVFFDEAQDANYFMLKLLDKQNVKRKYFIGDERQSIYKFGGTNENVFETIKFDKDYTLTQSFRFGKEIADLATKIIQLNSEHIVYGTEQTHETNPNSYARLYRTNARLFKDSLEIAYLSKLNGDNIKIDLLRSDGDESAYKEILAFLGLYYKYMKPSYYHTNRAYFDMEIPASLLAFKTRLEQGEPFLNVYNEHYDFLSDDIHQILNYAKEEDNFVEKFSTLKACRNLQNPSRIITMVTMHRSKGMEWDNVIIAEPTRLYYVDKDGIERRNSNFLQELNLAYVACTRARKNLDATILQEELSRENPMFADVPFVISEQAKEPVLQN